MSTRNDDLIADRTVLSSASTYFQLINALAYVHFIRSRGSRAEAIIGLGNYWTREMKSGPYAAFAKEIGAEFVDSVTFEERLRHWTSLTGVVLLTTTPSYRRANSRRREIAIDDGTASYRTDARLFYSDLKKIHGVIGTRAPGIVKHYLRHVRRRIRSILNPGLRFAILKDISSDNVEPNEDYLRSTRAVLEGLARHLPERDLPKESFALLILPPTRMPDVAPTTAALDALVRKMVADFGCVVLKPHPADDPAAFAFDGLPVHIDTSPGAVEHTMLEARDRISAVVSYRSTAAWTAKLLFDLPSYVVGPPVTDRNIERIFNALTESYGDPE